MKRKCLLNFEINIINSCKKPASFRIKIVKMKIIFTFVFSMFIVIASVQGQLGKGKSVIKYLGTTFLMNDGCPAPKCDASRSECQRIRQMVRALYSHCLQSQDGQHVGCVTDRIGDGSFLTIPVYATMCSAMCYETNPKYLKRIQRCPHSGERIHNAALANIIRK